MSTEEETLKELFDSIINKMGPYSRDPLTHAESVMEKASENALKIKTRLIEILKHMVREADNGEAVDVGSSARYLLESLGEKTENEY